MSLLSQERRVIEKFVDQQYVSRNYYIDLPYDKIPRLSGIIHKMKQKGWEFTTEEIEHDTIYRVNPYCVGYQEALKNI